MGLGIVSGSATYFLQDTIFKIFGWFSLKIIRNFLSLIKIFFILSVLNRTKNIIKIYYSTILIFFIHKKKFNLIFYFCGIEAPKNAQTCENIDLFEFFTIWLILRTEISSELFFLSNRLMLKKINITTLKINK